MEHKSSLFLNFGFNEADLGLMLMHIQMYHGLRIIINQEFWLHVADLGSLLMLSQMCHGLMITITL